VFYAVKLLSVFPEVVVLPSPNFPHFLACRKRCFKSFFILILFLAVSDSLPYVIAFFLIRLWWSSRGFALLILRLFHSLSTCYWK